ncbi:MAG: response regulator [SAR324 cluster bacterium]|nr:response regulator [SAR324 cluster bacterium]
MSDSDEQVLFEKEIREMTFVLIENNAVLRRTMIRILKGAGITKFVEADNGKEGTMMLKANRIVDVVILSDHLPDLESRRFLQTFAQDKKYEASTIVLISANHDTASIQKAISQGVDGYLTKPFPLHVLKNKVEEAIQNRKKRLALKDLRVTLEVPAVLFIKKEESEGVCMELARNECQVVVREDPGIGTRLQLRLSKMKEESTEWYEPIPCSIASASRVQKGFLLKIRFTHKASKAQGILSLMKQFAQ